MSNRIFDSSLKECDAGKLTIETYDDGYLTLVIDVSSDFPTFIVPPTREGLSEVQRIISALQKHAEILDTALYVDMVNGGSGNS